MKVITELQQTVNTITAEIASDEPCSDKIAGGCIKLKWICDLLIAKHTDEDGALCHEQVETLLITHK